MIDDYQKTMQLMEKMKEMLPFPVYPTKRLADRSKSEETHLRENQKINVIDLFYTGDEGGILCALESKDKDKNAFVVSLTHLVIPDDNPLANEIKAYQKKRTINIAIQDGKFGQAKRLMNKSKKKKGFG